jgi:hypothetical protein
MNHYKMVINRKTFFSTQTCDAKSCRRIDLSLMLPRVKAMLFADGENLLLRYEAMLARGVTPHGLPNSKRSSRG